MPGEWLHLEYLDVVMPHPGFRQQRRLAEYLIDVVKRVRDHPPERVDEDNDDCSYHDVIYDVIGDIPISLHRTTPSF